MKQLKKNYLNLIITARFLGVCCASMPMQWFTISIAAAYLGLSPTTLRRYDRAGALVPSRTCGHHRRYSRDQLDKFLGICEFNENHAQSSARPSTVGQLKR